MQIFAVLGSHPALSNAEISAVFRVKNLKSSQEVSLFQDESAELSHAMKKLGGSQKLGMIIGSFTDYQHEELAELLASFAIADAQDQKMTFGISVYDLGNPSKAGQLQTKRQALGLEVKKRLKGYGKNARYVTSKGKTLSAVDITKNQILERGAEFCFLVTTKEVFIGQTVAVQDYEDWSHRDYDRPARNAKRGMLPPKLARMMINLSGVDPTSHSLLDPFCGSGTVLMEASMLAYKHLTGTDISADAISDTRMNLDWLEQQGHEVAPLDLFESRAANVHALLAPESIDVVVTEPFLGTPRQGSESRAEIENRVSELTQLYLESFASIANVMKRGAIAVVAFPMNYVQGQAFPIPVEKVAKAAKLTIAQKPITYRQPGQHVGREIYTLKRK